jgi:type IV secretory pathway VirB2 component (pilin)
MREAMLNISAWYIKFCYGKFVLAQAVIVAIVVVGIMMIVACVSWRLDTYGVRE